MTTTPDNVNHPRHYEAERRVISLEPIDLCECLPFALGNAIKYILRAPHKGNRREDLQKAEWYLKRYMASRIGVPSAEGTEWRLQMALEAFSSNPALAYVKRYLGFGGIRVSPRLFAEKLLGWVQLELKTLCS